MSKKYKIILILNGILLTLSLFVGASYLYYLHNYGNDTSIVEVVDGLSINYLTNKDINYALKEDTYSFSVTNNSVNSLNYYIYLDNLVYKEENNYTFALTEVNNKKKEIIDLIPKESSYIASNIEINPKETHTYNLKITGGKFDDLKAQIKIGIEDNKDEIFASTIINHSKINNEPLTRVYESIATLDEGLIPSLDKDGTSYYFRGNVQNNYVEFAGFKWRIVKINGDNSIKLVLDDYINDTANFYQTTSSASLQDKINYNNSGVKTTLNNWYSTYLKEYESNIVASKYCVDDSISGVDGNKIYYLAYARINTDYNETYECLGTTYTSKIGLLSADEVAYAGASKNADNIAYYLYNSGKDQSFWTLTPGFSETDNITYYEVTNTGRLATATIGSYYRGIKPVINLIKSTYVSGSGTSSDPYVIKE